MFNFLKKRDWYLLKSNIKHFETILSQIEFLLRDSDLNYQANFIQQIIVLLSQKKYKEFEELINGVDLWGGSGAVWEVSFEDDVKARNFEKEIIKLIDLMEELKILGRGIKPIRKLFNKNSV